MGGGTNLYYFGSMDVKWGKIFYFDLSSLVYSNFNIVLSVINSIENLYQIYSAELHKIRFDLKQQL